METGSGSLVLISDWQRVRGSAFPPVAPGLPRFGAAESCWRKARRLLACALAVAVSIAVYFHVGQADAATYTWDANGAASGVTDGAGIWNTTAGNTVWWDGLANSVWSNAPVNDAIFGSSNGAAGTVTVGSAITVGNLTFNPASSGNYILQGAANGTGDTITLSGPAPTITTNASATIAARVTSTNGFVKEGLGTLTLRGSTAGSTLNVIPGTVTVNAGTLVVGPSFDGSGGQAALQGDLVLRGFARFRAVQGPYLSNTRLLDVGADAFAEINTFGDAVGAIAGAGRIQIATSSVLQLLSGTGDFSGVLSGAGGLLVSGASVTQRLTGANRHTGDTTVTSGNLNVNHVLALQYSTLNLGSLGNVNLGAAGVNTYQVGALGGIGSLNLGANTISVGGSNLGGLTDTVLSGSGGVTKVGTNTQTFRTAQLYTGRTTVGGGKVELVGAGTLSSSSTVTFVGTSEFGINGGNKTVSGVSRIAGNATLSAIYNNAATSLTITSLVARPVGATANFVVSGGTNGSSNKIVVTSAAPDAFLDHGTFFGGDNFAWNDAAGYVRALRYSGPADPNTATTAGGVTLPSMRHQETTGAVTAQTDAEFTTLKINGAHAFTLAAGQIVNVNGLLKTGSNATVSGGSFIRPSPGADLVVRTPASSDALTINTTIRDNSSSALVKSGLGSLTLGTLAVNSYSAGTFLNEGTLIVTQDSNLGSTVAENNVVLNGGTLQPAANFALHANHGIDVGPGGGAIYGNGFGLTLGSPNMLSGSGPLALTGNSNTNTILTSSATQDYTGRITLGANSFFAGRIDLGADNVVNPYGTGDITVISGGAGSAVYVNRPGSVWNNRFFISGNGAEGRGVIRTEQGGTFQGEIILTGDASISSDGTGTTTVLRGDVSGPFILTLGGRTGAQASNRYVLTGNNIHSATIVGLGITTIDHDVALGAYNGTVTIQTNATLQAGASGIILNPDRTIALTGGGLHYLDAQSFGLTVQGPITGGASDTLVLRGSGNVHLPAMSSYSGPTRVEAGTLSILADANLGTAPGSFTADQLTLAQGSTLAVTTGFTMAATRGITVAAGPGPSGVIDLAAGQTLTIPGGIVKNGTTLEFRGGVGSIFNANGVISGASANSDLVVNGGTTNLGAANTYNGPTFIRNGGILNANVGGALPAATRSAVTLDDSGSGGSTLGLGENNTVASLTGAATSTVALGANTLTVGTSSGTTTFAGDITGTGGITKDGASTQQLTGATTFTGATTINAGTLEAGSTGALAATSGIAVNTGGTLLLSGSGNRISDSAVVALGGGTFNTSGLSETVGALTLSASSVIDLGTNASANSLIFAASAGTWTGTLSIYNWTGVPSVGGGPDHVFFGTDGSGLNAGQLGQISFFSGPGTGFLGSGGILGNGEIVPVPEPSTILAALALLGLAGWREARLYRSGRRPLWGLSGCALKDSA